MTEPEVERKNRQREDELRRVPLQKIDKSKWPSHVREISIPETAGLGIDNNGRLYWNGRPVEIIGQRLDLTWWQNIVAIGILIFYCARSIRNRRSSIHRL
jgi:hypothetical protein